MLKLPIRIDRETGKRGAEKDFALDTSCQIEARAVGLSMQSRRPKEDGKRVRYYRLNPDDIAFAVKVLEHRQRQRDEREKKRREQEKKNAAYAAKMQTMYGVGTASNPPPILKMGIIIAGVWTQILAPVILGGNRLNIMLS